MTPLKHFGSAVASKPRRPSPASPLQFPEPVRPPDLEFASCRCLRCRSISLRAAQSAILLGCRTFSKLAAKFRRITYIPKFSILGPRLGPRGRGGPVKQFL